MGLLDIGEFLKTPEGVGLLSAAFGGMAGANRNQPWNTLGKAGLAGVMGYSNALENQQQQALRALQIKQVQQTQADNEAMRNFDFGKFYLTPQQQAMAANGGPTVSAQNAVGQYQPKFDTQGMIGSMISSNSPALRQQAMQMMAKEQEPLTVAKDAVLLDRLTKKPIFSNVQPEVKNGYLVLKNGQWVPDPALFELERKLKETGAPKVNVPVNVSTEKKYGEQFAGEIAKADSSMRDSALTAPDLADRANRIKQTIAGGKIITGFGADYRLALGKAMGIVGMSDNDVIANTEALTADLARNTLDAIKASGLGSGNGFSNADRDFLNKAAGGLITFNADTISRLADLSHRAASQSALKWNRRVKDIPDSALEGTGITRDPVIVPDLWNGNQSSISSGGWSAIRK